MAWESVLPSQLEFPLQIPGHTSCLGQTRSCTVVAPAALDESLPALLDLADRRDEPTPQGLIQLIREEDVGTSALACHQDWAQLRAAQSGRPHRCCSGHRAASTAPSPYSRGDRHPPVAAHSSTTA